MRLLDGDRATGEPRAPDRVGAFWLHAHDAHVRAALLQRERRAADEPAAAHRDDHGVDVGDVVEDLEAHRSLARDDERVAVGVDERLSLLALDPVRERERVVVHLAFEEDLGAVRAAHADDRVRHAARHDDRRGRAEPVRGVRHALGVAAGRRGDDAPQAGCVVERRDLVQRAAHLERARRLERLDLEEDLRAEQL